ncbi:hypothetical protein R3P38DRAFT_2571548, partial [Favolaschia claudopus]
VNLWCLPDPGVKPSQSLILLAKLAIYGSTWSTRGMLTLQGIINALQDRFLFFRQNPGEPWTRSIRHFLSLKAMFVKVEQSMSRKGVLWTLDITQGEGDKRKRKRRIRPNHPSPSQAEQMVSNEPLDSCDASQTFDLPTSSRPLAVGPFRYDSYGTIPYPEYGGSHFTLEPDSTL